MRAKKIWEKADGSIISSPFYFREKNTTFFNHPSNQKKKQNHLQNALTYLPPFQYRTEMEDDSKMVEKITKNKETYYIYNEKEHKESEKAKAFEQYFKKELNKYEQSAKLWSERPANR